ncbi:MOSC domain-containing protein [Tumebacillus sp. DT12]|uniref:MOSC domain-containing protein n=2 Tax=Tumebacillus lacus TaxID=2995335 RepID=A0ABT3WXE8_9BACL|nr:MOSC domain-containing protein [Tumebacillus lacus]MCX7569340.1 MOSC domain-containing protein [Tumebacillus lacus]
MSQSIEVVSLNVGRPQMVEYRGMRIKTGIFKQPVDGPVYLAKTNLEGDGQADLIHHGGENKAVMVYSYDHYPYWAEQIGREMPISAFGENLTVRGMLEHEVCIGDVYRLGEAVVQVCQPRVPCFKVEVRLGDPTVLPKVARTGYTGFYLRVLEEGMIGEDRRFERLERAEEGVSVAMINRSLYHEYTNLELLEEVLSAKALASEWRVLAEERRDKLRRVYAEKGKL